MLSWDSSHLVVWKSFIGHRTKHELDKTRRGILSHPEHKWTDWIFLALTTINTSQGTRGDGAVEQVGILGWFWMFCLCPMAQAICSSFLEDYICNAVPLLGWVRGELNARINPNCTIYVHLTRGSVPHIDSNIKVKQRTKDLLHLAFHPSAQGTAQWELGQNSLPVVCQLEGFRFNYVFKFLLKLLFFLIYSLSQASEPPRQGEFALSHRGHGGSLAPPVTQLPCLLQTPS